MLSSIRCMQVQASVPTENDRSLFLAMAGWFGAWRRLPTCGGNLTEYSVPALSLGQFIVKRLSGEQVRCEVEADRQHTEHEHRGKHQVDLCTSVGQKHQVAKTS